MWKHMFHTLMFGDLGVSSHVNHTQLDTLSVVA